MSKRRLLRGRVLAVGCALLPLAVAVAQDFPSAELIAAQRQSLPVAAVKVRTADAPAAEDGSLADASAPAETEGAPAPGGAVMQATPGSPSPFKLVGRERTGGLLAEPRIDPKEMQPWRMLGSVVEPGSFSKLRWVSGESFVGQSTHTPVLVKHGVKPGPVLCLTGAIHGDELNGIEVIRRIVAEVDPKQLSGTIIGVPIVNLSGFARGSRYLPDRRDLNRFFPGSRRGSNASRIAYSFFNEVADRCTHLVDFHTGSFERSNLPQVRGDLRIPAVQEFARGFGATTVLHSAGSPGMLRRACTARGIAAVTFEIGAPIRLEPEEINHGVRALETLLDKMGMVNRVRVWKEPQPFFYQSKWVRSPMGGMLFSSVKLGDRVKQGQLLGKVIDPVDNHEYPMEAPYAGRVLGMALNQIVMPGFATYHMGADTTEGEAVRQAARNPSTVDGDADRMEDGSTEQVEDVVSERREERRGSDE